jgi:hypothetical protein
MNPANDYWNVISAEHLPPIDRQVVITDGQLARSARFIANKDLWDIDNVPIFVDDRYIVNNYTYWIDFPDFKQPEAVESALGSLKTEREAA